MFRSFESRLSRLLIASGKCFSSTKPCETIVSVKIPFIEQLSAEFNEDASRIASVIENESLDKIQLSEWKDRFRLLNAYTFSYSECFQMIGSYPNILKMPLYSLKDATQQWSQCDLGHDNFKNLLITLPQFLDLDLDVIIEKLPHLRRFVKSRESLVSLLINCPNIMYDHWECTQAKIQFLTEKKGVSRGEILNSYALSHSLEFIKFRLAVLEKCGIYITKIVKPHKKNKYDRSQHRNPNLKKILDVDDKFFSKNIAKISLEEYNVCNELFTLNQFGDLITNDDDDDSTACGYGDDDEEDLSLSYKKNR